MFICLYFQVQYTFGPLYSFLVRLTGIIFTHGYFRRLFFLTDGCGPLLRHPELRAPPYFTCHHWENNVHWLENAMQKCRVKLYPVHATTAEARYRSFLPEHLAQEKNLLPLTRIRTPDRPVVEYATATP